MTDAPPPKPCESIPSHSASEDATALLEEQDNKVTLLVAVDACHVKQLASERVLQELYATAWWRLNSRQRYHLRSATSSESVEALWLLVSERCTYDCAARALVLAGRPPNPRIVIF